MNVSFPLRDFCPAGMGRAIVALALATLGGIAQPVGAALMLTEVSGSATASADFFGTSFPPSATDSEFFRPFGGAAVAEVGRTRAVQTDPG